MCGIFGFLGKKYNDSNIDLKAMKNSLIHRGPNHFDYFSNQFLENEINIGHLRLSVIDTSSNGNQPMRSHSGRYIIVYNGEVYNYKEIKKELIELGINSSWKSDSDTEVILAAIEYFGLDGCLKRIVGMFAFALWDIKEQKLTLARDRIGEKPLYYGLQSNQLIFASELKAFEVNSKFESQLDFQSAIGFLTRGYVPNNQAIYKNINKVPPGNYIQFKIDEVNNDFNVCVNQYWSLEAIIKMSNKKPFKGNYETAKIELENLLIRAIKEQTISDVPLGAFLSGGVDSSLVCAILKKHVFKSQLVTFTIAMPSPGINEAEHAEKVAQYIGTKHNSKELKIVEVVNRIEEILGSWDEPFADSSQIPTFFVSEFAKNSVTVALSGDGADEFMFGYPDYVLYTKYNKYLFLVNLKFDILVNSLIRIKYLKKIKTLNRISNFFFLLKLISEKNSGEALINWKNKFRRTNLPIQMHLQGIGKEYLKYNECQFEYIGYYDVKDYLPNDILVKVDRAAMAFSLESRAPFLDHRVIEFIISLPESFKYDKEKQTTKKILKDILYKYVPKEIVDRPKQGFSIPLSYWLKNDLQEWALSIINGIPEVSEFWNKNLILDLFNDHLSNKIDNSEKIWNILVLESFFKRKKLLHHKFSS